MRFTQSPKVMVRRTKGKGWGVYARKAIPINSTIEEVPVLLIPTRDLWQPEGTSALADYAFVWDDDHVAIALGYGSLYNHSFTPNAQYIDDDPCLKRYVALRDIQHREEITINYNALPHDKSDVGFEVQ